MQSKLQVLYIPSLSVHSSFSADNIVSSLPLTKNIPFSRNSVLSVKEESMNIFLYCGYFQETNCNVYI